MIYTSNYARQSGNPLAISISKVAPRWFTGKRLEVFSPTWEMIKGSKLGKMDNDQYTRQYLQLLIDRKADPHQILDLPDGTMLLCYETPTDFCHRHILADWVEYKTGVHIPEWLNEKESKSSKQDALVDSLFEM